MGLTAKTRYGMIGGGEGAFIGEVHRRAARLDDAYEFVCGAVSGDPERALRAAAAVGLPPGRCYPDYTTMLRAEGALPAAERMQCVVIVTPNHLHFPIATAALNRGFHVLSDKPATIGLDECRRLQDLIAKTGLLYGLMHPYPAYPMVLEARERVAAGRLGRVRKVIVEYTQGWLAEPVERRGNAQARWRMDPEQAGPSCCIGDIGVHAFNLIEWVTGLNVTALCAEVNRTVAGRLLDDDGAAFLRFDNGAHGVLLASQICVGDENDLRLRVYGDHASLDWRQQEPNSLWLKYADRPAELIRTGAAGVGPAAQAYTRLPAGHPEGYIEAFANVYRAFAAQIRAQASGAAIDRGPVAGIEAALRGMAFIETVLAASAANQKWHPFPTVG